MHLYFLSCLISKPYIERGYRSDDQCVGSASEQSVLEIIRCKSIRFPTISLYDLGVIPLKVINQYELLFWFYKIVKNKICHHFQFVRVAQNLRYPTRTNNDFVISSFRTNWGRNCILIDGLTKFNDFPDSLRHLKPISRTFFEIS
jgi:hypothetical protein